MSETRGNGADNSTITLADRLYPGGPIDGPGDGRQRELINEGVAKPAVSLFADERAAPRGDEQRAEPAFDPAKLEGYQNADPIMKSAIEQLGRIGVTERQAPQLAQLYDQTVKANEEAHVRSLQANAERLARELPAEDIQMVRELINDPNLTPEPMKDWVLRWGNDEAVATMLARWARAIRTGRY